jgi:hypothetical protein
MNSFGWPSDSGDLPAPALDRRFIQQLAVSKAELWIVMTAGITEKNQVYKQTHPVTVSKPSRYSHRKLAP